MTPLQKNRWYYGDLRMTEDEAGALAYGTRDLLPRRQFDVGAVRVDRGCGVWQWAVAITPAPGVEERPARLYTATAWLAWLAAYRAAHPEATQH